MLNKIDVKTVNGKDCIIFELNVSKLPSKKIEEWISKNKDILNNFTKSLDAEYIITTKSNKENNVEELKTLTENIKKLRLENIDYYNMIIDLKKKVETTKSIINSVIVNELDDAGKKKYSNAEARQLEFEKRIVGNSEYSNNLQVIKQYEEKAENNRIEIEYFDRMFRYIEISLK